MMALRTLVVLSLATLALAGCGVRGALEAPPSATAPVTPAGAATPAGASAPARATPVADRPFILDGLLL
jgi:predicted small lipoprotein YifL